MTHPTSNRLWLGIFVAFLTSTISAVLAALVYSAIENRPTPPNLRYTIEIQQTLGASTPLVDLALIRAVSIWGLEDSALHTVTTGGIAEKISKPELLEIRFRVTNNGETRANNVRFEVLTAGDLAGFIGLEGSVCQRKNASNAESIIVDCDSIAGGQTKVLTLGIFVPARTKEQALEIAHGILAKSPDIVKQVNHMAALARQLQCADAVVRIASPTRSLARLPESSAAPNDASLASASDSVIKKHSVSAQDGRSVFAGSRDFLPSDSSGKFAEPLPVDPAYIVTGVNMPPIRDSQDVRVELLVPRICAKIP